MFSVIAMTPLPILVTAMLYFVFHIVITVIVLRLIRIDPLRAFLLLLLLVIGRLRALAISSYCPGSYSYHHEQHLVVEWS